MYLISLYDSVSMTTKIYIISIYFLWKKMYYYPSRNRKYFPVSPVYWNQPMTATIVVNRHSPFTNPENTQFSWNTLIMSPFQFLPNFATWAHQLLFCYSPSSDPRPMWETRGYPHLYGVESELHRLLDNTGRDIVELLIADNRSDRDHFKWSHYAFISVEGIRTIKGPTTSHPKWPAGVVDIVNTPQL